MKGDINGDKDMMTLNVENSTSTRDMTKFQYINEYKPHLTFCFCEIELGLNSTF